MRFPHSTIDHPCRSWQSRPGSGSDASSRKGTDLPRLRSVESAKLMEHQMYFWGRDVMHPSGNLLVAAGCERFRREDCAHMVSCYRYETESVVIILHSTGVSLRGKEGGPGVVYLRPTHRLYQFEEGFPLPYQASLLRSLRRLRPNEFPPALTGLLAFVQAYEQWASGAVSRGSRLAAWREQRSTATKGVRWLKPSDSMRWLERCLAARRAVNPAELSTLGPFEFGR